MLRHVAKALLRIGGWTAVGDDPDVDKAVILAAPHTSNWDGVWAIIYKISRGLDIRFFAKQSLFWFPMNHLLRALGALSIDRKDPGSAVAQAVKGFRDNESYYFALAPEGSRSKKSGWKSGFYRLAEEAGVPVVLGFIDYRTKRLGLGPRIDLTGDRGDDLTRIREFYSTITGHRPENASPVEFSSGR